MFRVQNEGVNLNMFKQIWFKEVQAQKTPLFIKPYNSTFSVMVCEIRVDNLKPLSDVSKQ